MRALVTGGAGYIGSVVANYLLDKGHQVTIIDNLSTGSSKNIPKNATFYKYDISNVKMINKIFIKKKFDIVFHFAAFINNEESLKFPKKYYNNNFTKEKFFLIIVLKIISINSYTHLPQLFMEIRIRKFLKMTI